MKFITNIDILPDETKSENMFKILLLASFTEKKTCNVSEAL